MEISAKADWTLMRMEDDRPGHQIIALTMAVALASTMTTHLMSRCCCFIVVTVSFVGGNKMKEPTYPEPRFLPRLLNVTVREGVQAKLPCAVHFLGTQQVTWRKVGGHHFLTIGHFKWVKDHNVNLETVRLTPEVTEWNLLLARTSRREAGLYQCRISASADVMTRFVRLNVVGPPVVAAAVHQPSTIHMSGKRYVERAQPIHLFCNTTGSRDGSDRKLKDYNQFRVDWFKDGESLLDARYRHVIITHYYLVQSRTLVSELRIDRSKAEDTGTYICRSPTDLIASRQVTVLLAGKTNVKRDNANIESFGSPSSAAAISTELSFCLIIITFLIGLPP